MLQTTSPGTMASHACWGFVRQGPGLTADSAACAGLAGSGRQLRVGRRGGLLLVAAGRQGSRLTRMVLLSVELARWLSSPVYVAVLSTLHSSQVPALSKHHLQPGLTQAVGQACGWHHREQAALGGEQAGC